MSLAEPGDGSPALVWDEAFEVGDVLLDAQHRHIVDLINALHRAADGEGVTTADVVVDHIGRFLQYHFETEENLLRQVGYVGLEQHIIEHRKLLALVRGAAHSIGAADQADAERFATVVWSCLHEHTAIWDKDFAEVLHRQQ